MLQIKNGNNKAFDELYNRYSKRILNFFFKKLYQNEEKANDFLQDLFLKIIEKPELFNSTKKFSTWIYTIAFNMCKNEYRSNQIRGKKESNFDLNLLLETAEIEPLISNYDKNIFIQSLNTALESLNENQKETFNLRHREMLSINEISILMDCSTGTVKSRLFYATKELSNKLKVFKFGKETSYEN